MKSNAIEKQLKQAGTAINNTLKQADIKAAMLPYGYTVTKLNEGKALYNTADAAVDDAASALGIQLDATDAVNLAFKEARAEYQGLAKLARVVFAKQSGALTALGLNKPMPRTLDAFTKAAGLLFNYDNYTQPMKDALEEKSFGSGEISLGRAKVAALEDAREVQADLIGKTQDATAVQNEALKLLHEWYMEFRKLARIALKNKPQFLKRLGIPHRVTKSKAQRGAPAKAAATRAARKLAA